MFWVLIFVAVVALLYVYLIKPHQHWSKVGVIHTRPKFFVGDSWGTISKTQSIAEFVLDIYNRFPNSRYSGFYQLLMPTLLLRDPELIKQITVKDFDHFVDHKTLIPEDADPLWGKNLFALQGQRWRDLRATLSPSFTSSKMKSMFILMSEVAENFVNYFKKLPEEKIAVEMKDIFTRYTNDVIATTAFGIKVDSMAEQDNEFYVMGKEATDFSGFWRNLKFLGFLIIPKVYGWLKIPLFSGSVSKFFRRLIKETIKTREEKGIVRPDMINLLMEARKGIQSKEDNNTIDSGFAVVEESDIGKTKITRELTDDDITAQALIFFFAGFDSVSSLMCFMAYELAVNQEIQDKLREELKGECTYENILKMKYLDMIVSETLRKWPNAVAVDRVCTKPYTIQAQEPGERPLHLPVNSLVWLPIFGIHRDPQYYPEPEKFDPERFSDENKGNIRPYTYLPFGAGPRNCIGSRFAILETKVLMYHILRNFKIVPNGKSVIPLRYSKKSFNLNSEDGFCFDFQRI